MPQGKKSEVMVQHQPTEQAIPKFLPIPQRAQSSEAQPSVRDESGEVPSPADELGVGGTHGFEGSFSEAHESAEPGMDIDPVEANTDVDLKQQMATLRRDEKLEIEETNREIMAVLNRFWC